jgi:hypothetical protein
MQEVLRALPAKKVRDIPLDVTSFNLLLYVKAVFLAKIAICG